MKDIGFVSHCLGANSTIIAMSKKPDKFSKVRALAAIQPISTNILVKCMLKDKYPLFKSRYENINKKSKQYTGYTLEEMSPAEYVKDIRVPTLYVQVREDPWTEPHDIQDFYINTPEPKQIFWIDGYRNRFDGYNYFGENPRLLLDYLKKYM